jgi:hypothetical protein
MLTSRISILFLSRHWSIQDRGQEALTVWCFKPRFQPSGKNRISQLPDIAAAVSMFVSGIRHRLADVIFLASNLHSPNPNRHTVGKTAEDFRLSDAVSLSALIVHANLQI